MQFDNQDIKDLRLVHDCLGDDKKLAALVQLPTEERDGYFEKLRAMQSLRGAITNFITRNNGADERTLNNLLVETGPTFLRTLRKLAALSDTAVLSEEPPLNSPEVKSHFSGVQDAVTRLCANRDIIASPVATAASGLVR